MYNQPISKRDIGDGSIALSKRVSYDRSATGKMREAIVYVRFPVRKNGLDAIVSVFHPLRRIPQFWSVVGSGIDSDPSRVISVPGCFVNAGSLNVLRCGTPGLVTPFAGILKGDTFVDNPPAGAFPGMVYVLDVDLTQSILLMSEPATAPIAYPPGITVDFSQATARAPGLVYTDNPAPFTETSVAFRCTVPCTWAKIALR